MRNYYYMFELTAIDTTEDAVKDAIKSELSLGNRRKPVFHGVHTSPKDGAVHATWMIDSRTVEPSAKAGALMLQLGALMMRLERKRIFATLHTNTRSV
jgi:hypothetical protein